MALDRCKKCSIPLEYARLLMIYGPHKMHIYILKRKYLVRPSNKIPIIGKLYFESTRRLLERWNESRGHLCPGFRGPYGEEYSRDSTPSLQVQQKDKVDY